MALKHPALHWLCVRDGVAKKGGWTNFIWVLFMLILSSLNVHDWIEGDSETVFVETSNCESLFVLLAVKEN